MTVGIAGRRLIDGGTFRGDVFVSVEIETEGGGGSGSSTAAVVVTSVAVRGWE